MSEIEVPYNWTPRLYQMPTWNYFMEGGKRGACIWHRRAGKDLFGINLCGVASTQRQGLYWHILPTYNQGRKVVWEGYTRDGRRFIDHFHPELVDSKNNTDMRITLKTGSTYQVVGAEDPDRLVGTNPIGVIFSEYSLHDPYAYDILRPILAENGGWALFIYTARGRNHGHRLLEMAKRNPSWHVSVLKAGSGPDATKREDGTPVISDEVIQEERDAGMEEELIQQEFFCSFEAPIIGAYYAKQMAAAHGTPEGAPPDEPRLPNRITVVPWEPGLPVHTSWDLGMDDHTCIWFIQQYGEQLRVIDYYENNGEGLEHYVKQLGARPYVYGSHYAPHDIEVRELGTGRSRKETAQLLGIRFTTVKIHSVEDGVNAVRQIIPQCWFDKDKCQRGINALSEYRREYDEKKLTYKNTPVHDWTSHPADAFRQFAMGHRLRKKYTKAPQERADSDYSILEA